MRILSTVSIYLIFTYSVVLANQFANTNPQQPVDGHKKSYSNDFDELRISNNQLAVGRSTNISANVRPGGGGSNGGAGVGSSSNPPTGGFLREGGIEQRVTSRNGKPMISLPVVHVASKSHPNPPPTHSSQSHHHHQQQQQQPSSSQGGSSSSLRVASNSHSNTAQQQYGNTVCSWMSLREFKKVTLDTNELILRDHEDRASYILAMKAFIKWTDDDYFPLNSMKALPFVDHIPLLEVPHDGASAHDPRNCSFIATTMADRLAEVPGDVNRGAISSEIGVTRLYLVKDDPIRFFEEHIKIVVDCGYYLILHIQGDGYHLILNSISFYQNPAAKRSKQVPMSGEEIGRFDQDPEGLVFSTKGTKNSPLLTMPLTSRYMCQKRIVLTGNNSIQLVLERFELQRLMGRLLELPINPSVPLTSSTLNERRTSTNRDEDGPSLFHHYPSINRHKRDTLKYYDIPLCPLNTSVTFVERCPEPSSRMAPLSSMMLNATIMQRKNHPKGKFFADKWTVMRSTLPNGSSARISSSLTTLYFILALFLVRTLSGILTVITSHID